MILTQVELAAITRRERPTAQARILRLLGVPFRAHPSDNVLLVSRAAAENALGVSIEEASRPEYEVDIEGIRSHGQTQTAH